MQEKIKKMQREWPRDYLSLLRTFKETVSGGITESTTKDHLARFKDNYLRQYDLDTLYIRYDELLSDFRVRLSSVTHQFVFVHLGKKYHRQTPS